MRMTRSARQRASTSFRLLADVRSGRGREKVTFTGPTVSSCLRTCHPDCRALDRDVSKTGFLEPREHLGVLVTPGVSRGIVVKVAANTDLPPWSADIAREEPSENRPQDGHAPEWMESNLVESEKQVSDSKWEPQNPTSMQICY